MLIPTDMRTINQWHKHHKITPGMTVWAFNGLTASIPPYKAILGNQTRIPTKTLWPEPNPRAFWYVFRPIKIGKKETWDGKRTDTRTICTDEKEAWLLYEEQLHLHLTQLQTQMEKLQNHIQDIHQHNQTI